MRRNTITIIQSVALLFEMLSVTHVAYSVRERRRRRALKSARDDDVHTTVLSRLDCGDGDDGSGTGRRMATGSLASAATRRRTTTPVPFERQRHMTYCLTAWKHHEIVDPRRRALFRRRDATYSSKQRGGGGRKRHCNRGRRLSSTGPGFYSGAANWAVCTTDGVLRRPARRSSIRCRTLWQLRHRTVLSVHGSGYDHLVRSFQVGGEEETTGQLVCWVRQRTSVEWNKNGGLLTSNIIHMPLFYWLLSVFSLPQHLRSPTINRDQFRIGLKPYLFKCAYTWLYLREPLRSELTNLLTIMCKMLRLSATKSHVVPIRRSTVVTKMYATPVTTFSKHFIQLTDRRTDGRSGTRANESAVHTSCALLDSTHSLLGATRRGATAPELRPPIDRTADSFTRQLSVLRSMLSSSCS